MSRKLLIGFNNIRESLKILVKVLFIILRKKRFIFGIILLRGLNRFIKLKILNKLILFFLF